MNIKGRPASNFNFSESTKYASCLNLLDLDMRYEISPRTSQKSIMLPKIVLTFHCLNELF
jgi:hypothetical protein